MEGGDGAAYDRLASLGRDTVQGYDASRPLPAPDLERWLRDRGRGRERDAGQGQSVA